jgi:hypothetical protein
MPDHLMVVKILSIWGNISAAQSIAIIGIILSVSLMIALNRKKTLNVES